MEPGNGVNQTSQPVWEVIECSICLENIESEAKSNAQDRSAWKCNHIFHKDCIDGWLVKDSTCPNCRAEVIVSAPEVSLINEMIRNEVLAVPDYDPQNQVNAQRDNIANVRRENVTRAVHGYAVNFFGNMHQNYNIGNDYRPFDMRRNRQIHNHNGIQLNLGYQF